MRLWRARSSSTGAVLDVLASAEAPRARRLASRFAEKSPSTGVSGGAVADGGTGGVATAGAGPFFAMTGGVGGGRGADGGGGVRFADRGGGGGGGGAGDADGAGGALVAGLGGGARRTASAPLAFPRSARAENWSATRGTHSHSTAAWRSSDSATATRIAGIFTVAPSLRGGS